MTVKELYDVCQSNIKVLSGYDSHVLCKYFNPKKHVAIGEKEILNLWADVEVSRHGFTPYVGQIISVYVHEDEEYIRKKEKMKHDKKAVREASDGSWFR